MVDFSGQLCFDEWNFTWIRKFVTKSLFKESWKNTSEPLKNISCFRIVMLFPNCWWNKFFSAVSWGVLFYRENTVMNPQNTKCHRSPNIIFFRHFWYLSITKAIHTYVRAKFEKISIFFIFNTSARNLRRPLLNHFLSFIQCSDIVYKGLIRLTVFNADSF